MKKNSGEGFRFDIDDLPEIAFVTDRDRAILAANRTASALLGYDFKEFAGRPIDSLYSERPSGLPTRGIDSGAGKFEVKLGTKDGSTVLASFVVAPIGDGGTEAFLYLGRDIRLRKLVEGEIRKARDYFRTIIQDSPNGICVTDANRRIVMTNKAAEDLTGYGSDDLIGGPVTVFYPGGSDERGIDVEALRRGGNQSREVALRRKDGTTVPVLVLYRAVEDERGETMFIESYSDLSDRKRLDRLKNEFVFIAAHELRNPVSAIRLLLNVVFEDRRLALDPILRGYLQKIQEADDRLIQLVDDLLEVSRSESGRLKIQVSPQDIAVHVETIFSELRPTALAKDVRFRHVQLSRMPQVMADPHKLKEIIANLVSNAVKYNVTGGMVTVEHEIKDKFLVTMVTDKGIGIAPDDIARLFGKFWRSDDVAVRAQAGTGLGLYIVKELVGRMGGTVGVRSKKGKGTEFSFTLPIATTALLKRKTDKKRP